MPGSKGDVQIRKRKASCKGSVLAEGAAYTVLTILHYPLCCKTQNAAVLHPGEEIEPHRQSPGWVDPRLGAPYSFALSLARRRRRTRPWLLSHRRRYGIRRSLPVVLRPSSSRWASAAS